MPKRLLRRPDIPENKQRGLNAKDVRNQIVQCYLLRLALRDKPSTLLSRPLAAELSHLTGTRISPARIGRNINSLYLTPIAEQTRDGPEYRFPKPELLEKHMTILIKRWWDDNVEPFDEWKEYLPEMPINTLIDEQYHQRIASDVES